MGGVVRSLGMSTVTYDEQKLTAVRNEKFLFWLKLKRTSQRRPFH